MTQSRPRTRGTPRSGRSKRAVEWYSRTLFNTAVAASGQSNLDLSSEVPDALKKGGTIIRTLLDLTVNANLASTTTDVSLGLVLVTADALAAGAFPDARAFQDEPGWLYKNTCLVRGDASFAAAYQGTHIKEDLRGRRKFTGEEMRYVLLMEAGTAAGLVITGLVRWLLMKP